MEIINNLSNSFFFVVARDKDGDLDIWGFVGRRIFHGIIIT